MINRIAPLRLNKSYTTHMPMVLKAIQLTTGPVLELGSGPFSTPLLHWLCAEGRRPLYTFEEVEEYFNFAKGFQSKTHRIRLIKDWSNFKIKGHWSVALIDQYQNRAKMAIYLKDKVDYILLHDSEAHCYDYDKVWPYFKYRFDWKFAKPWTTVLSNFKDLSQWN